MKSEPTKHKDETYIQRRIRMSAKTARHFMDSDNMGTTSEDCKVTCKDHVFTVTKDMKKQSLEASPKSMVLTHQAGVKAVLGDWQAISDRYARWYHKVFVEDTTHIPTADWALLNPKTI